MIFHRLILTALCSIFAVGEASLSSFGPKNEENSQEQALVPSHIQDTERYLQNKANPGFNCLVTAEIDCFLISDNSDCKDLRVRRDLCSTIDVMMSYKFCNENEDEDEEIVFRPELTVASFYNDATLKLNTNNLKPKECRTMYRQLRVDTCKRNWIVASLKVEGWKSFYENKNNYCFVYSFYFPPITKYDRPTLAPVPNIPIVPPEIVSNTVCYLETFVGSGDFTFPCGNLDLDYFIASLDQSVISTQVSPYKRNIKIVTTVVNKSVEDLDVLDASVTIVDDLYKVVGPNDNIVLTTEEPLLIPSEFAIDFAEFSGESIDILSEILARGQKTLLEAGESDTITIDVPVIEFDWELDPNIGCTIDATGEDCEDYIMRRGECDVDVAYMYKASNIGTKCEHITNAKSLITTSFSSDSNDISLDGFTDSELLFCPGQELEITQVIEQNLCDEVGVGLAGEEVDFELSLNNIPGNTKAGFIKFPLPNTLTAPPAPAPLPFKLKFDPTLHCFVAEGTNREQTCQDYIVSTCKNDNSPVDVTFKSKVSNIGDGCLYIKKVKSFLETVTERTKYLTDTSSWSEEEKNLCPGENLRLINDVPNFDLCSFAETEIVVEYSLNRGGGENTGFALIDLKAPTGQFELYVNPNLLCFVDYRTDQEMSCQDYIFGNCANNDDPVDVTYVGRVENVGEICEVITKVEATVNEDVHVIDISSWGNQKKEFCPGEKLKLLKEFPDYDLCAVAGSSIDVEITLSFEGGEAGGDASGMTSIELGTPNQDTPPPLPAPSPPSPSTCRSSSFEFKIVNKSCSSQQQRSISLRKRRQLDQEERDTIVNLRTRRYLDHKGSKRGRGKGSSKHNPPCDECDSCVDHDSVSTKRLTVQIYSLDNPSNVLYTGTHRVDTTFEFDSSCTPDCLVIDVSCTTGGNDKMVQTVSFDTVSSASVGASFGAIEIVNLS